MINLLKKLFIIICIACISCKYSKTNIQEVKANNDISSNGVSVDLVRVVDTLPLTFYNQLWVPLHVVRGTNCFYIVPYNLSALLILLPQDIGYSLLLYTPIQIYQDLAARLCLKAFQQFYAVVSRKGDIGIGMDELA